MKKKNKEDFIFEARKIHSCKYDYSKVEYVNSRTKVCIICPEHGEFWQLPNAHKSGCGCPKCRSLIMSSKIKSSTEDFIEKSKKVHSDKYDYSKVEYVNATTRVCIICPEHGEFWQKPSHHLLGCGCQVCKSKNTSIRCRNNNDIFIQNAKKVHGAKYDYSKVEYVNNKTKVCIICPKHGEFWQTPNSHLNGEGCKKCSYEERGIRRRDDTESFINKAALIHSNKYDYSKVNYILSDIPVKIICEKHGEFLQTPEVHLGGHGCPRCKSSMMENEIREFLINNGIDFEEQKRFKWLGLQSLDFYLTEYNMAIECQGIQHFDAIDYFGGYDGYLYTQKRDKLKKELCENNNIVILYYSNFNYNFPYKVYIDKNELLQEIKLKKKI